MGTVLRSNCSTLCIRVNYVRAAAAVMNRVLTTGPAPTRHCLPRPRAITPPPPPPQNDGLAAPSHLWFALVSIALLKYCQ